jgi:uncharacterized protein with ParB-like and HNH nuclease domain
MTTKAILETKLVGDIEGDFIIKEYQRGYRWEKEQIEMLLNDIRENGNLNYCLQPIVLKKLKDKEYELIDGQQRLTTILLILKAMQKYLPMVALKYSIDYETRLNVHAYLNSLDESLIDNKIDYYYIFMAFSAAKDWFADTSTGDPLQKAMDIYTSFNKNIKVIWYEVEGGIDSNDLFTRLNIGKIPLTNAELVKALFLNRDSEAITEEKQLEIAATWDQIENSLHNSEFWAFLTNKKREDYPSKIELLFEIISDQNDNERDKYATFNWFSNTFRGTNTDVKKKTWAMIVQQFNMLKEWFENGDIFHKVGYLIFTGHKINNIINTSKNLTKSKLNDYLDDLIKQKINLNKDDLISLSYSKAGDKGKIEKILLLFNAETCRLLKNTNERYSFDSYKSNKWSLEHIHAQNSEGLNKKELQLEWLRMHRLALDSIKSKSKDPAAIEELINDIDAQWDSIDENVFRLLFDRVFEAFTLETDLNISYIDSVFNMALLSSANNAALNNSTFDVKRNMILELDKKGEYIPICTKRVFFKYYTESADHQLHFWSEQDRNAYMNAMIGKEGVIIKYLNQ